MKTTCTTVIFGPEVDYVMALYVNGKCVTSGTEYDDKISAFITGYIQGLKTCNEVVEENFLVPAEDCEDILEACDSSPEVWPDDIYSKYAKSV